MSRMAPRLALCLSLAAVLPSVARADYCPPDSPLSGDMRDIMLIYISDGAWAVENFRPYVAYLDKQAGGQPRDWFYDSFLFLMFGGAPSGGAYYNGTATKADWDHYLGLLFSPDRCLVALDACIEEMGARLGDPDRVCPVIIMIPYLSKGLDRFGDVDGDGRDEDPADDADRVKAFHWVADAILDRWRAQTYAHLKLWGFYWMHEGASPADRATIRAVADHVHARGFGFHWIPWFRAPGYDVWRDLGFDFVVMQPNFAFIKAPGGAVVPDEGRLTDNAESCRALGLGVEMELDSQVATDPGQRLNLQLYLNHGVDDLDGYMTSAVRAYYQGYDFIAQLYRSDLPACNRLYDDLYRFHKSTYQRRAVSLCEGAPATLNGRPEPRLTDGLWLTRGDRPDRVPLADSPAVVELDLGAAQILGDVRVHVAARDDGGAVPPSLLRVLTSLDGREFRPAAEAPAPILQPAGDWKAGFALLTFEPRFARFLRVEVPAPAGRVAVDEVVAFPAPHLLGSVAYRIEGSVAPDLAPGAPGVLSDGRLSTSASRDGAVGFTDGRGSVALDLDDDWYLSAALAHARWAGEAPASCRVRLAGGAAPTSTDWVTARGVGEGWIEIPLPLTPVRSLAFDLRGGPDVLWDELQVRRGANRAAGKPYRIEPPFEARYPDTAGTELTDGVLSETGFGDGGTVGWYGGEVAVTLDLGADARFDALRLHVEGGGYAAVDYPSVVEAWASDDGQAWRLLTGEWAPRQVVYSQAMGDGLNELAWLRLSFAATVARYVRVRCDTAGWLMLSEVQVLAGEDNLAAGRPYYLSPAPTSSAKYADDAAKLTDGEYSRSGDGWGKAVGWSTVDPEVVVDLLQPADVSIVRAHVLGGGQGAVFFPRTVSVATSLDGLAWSEDTSTDVFPTESGNESLAAFMSAQLDVRQARYVRVRLTRKGWAMLDEIEVY